MNVIELLLYEHSALRVIRNEWENGYQRVQFERLNDFIINHHAKVEDKYVFPKIKFFNSEDKSLIKEIDRISADHKLIQTLGTNLVNWININDEDMIKRRMPLYWKILSEHNIEEEKTIFHRWKGDLENIDDIIESIKAFGKEEYIKITGVSSLMLEMYLAP
ncbi:MAG: hemerythrin domain-containing protein [Nitrososphaeria archaeon]